MKLRYNYRLYPSKHQEHLMKQAGGTCRWLWNHFLEENIKKYEEDKEFIELNGDKFTPRQELPGTPLDVMADILSSDMISATQMKEEAVCSLDAQ